MYATHFHPAEERAMARDCPGGCGHHDVSPCPTCNGDARKHPKAQLGADIRLQASCDTCQDKYWILPHSCQGSPHSVIR